MQARLVGTGHERGREALSKATTPDAVTLPTRETTVAVLKALRAPQVTIEEWTVRHALDDAKFRGLGGTDTRRGSASRTIRPSTHWRVPVVRRTPFMGRSGDLLAITQAFGNGNRSVVLHGLPGMGKTQLAAHFAHFRASAYDTVWWVHAGDAARVRADLAGLGKRVRRGTLRDDDTLVADALDFLRQHPRYLLIADGAEDPSILGETVPDLDGHLLVTTNKPRFEYIGKLLDVQPVGRRAAAVMLTGTPRVPARLKPLLDTIGGYPLVLQQARGYVDSTGTTYAEYHRMLANSASTSLVKSPVPGDYPRNAVAALELSIEEAENRVEGARAHLETLSWGADAPYPSGLAAADLTGGAPASGAATVSALNRLALVNVQRGSVAVHGLLASVVRDQDRPRRGLSRLTRHLAAVVPHAADETVHRSLWAAALPHVLVACGHYVANDTRDAVERAHLLDRAATYLHSRGRFQQAVPLFVDAIALIEATAGRNDPRCLRYRNDLTLTRRYLPDADMEEVIADFTDLLAATAALRDDTKTSAVSTSQERRQFEVDLADVHHNLGGAYVFAGHSELALPHLQAAIDTYEQVWPTHRERKQHPHLAQAYTNLAWAYIDSDNRQAAEEASRRALGLASPGDVDRDVERAFAISNLGVAIEWTHPAEAAELHRQAATIRRRIDGPNSASELGSIINRGGALREQAKADGDTSYADLAARLHRQVMRAARDLLRDHEILDAAENNLGLDLRVKALVLAAAPRQTTASLAQTRQAHRDAVTHLRAVHDRRTAHLPSDHFLVHQSRLNLGAALRDSGRPADAIQLFTDALEALPDNADLTRVFVLDHRAIAFDAAGDVRAARQDANEGLRLIGDDDSPHLIPLKQRFRRVLAPRRS